MTDDFFAGFERFDVAVDHAHGGATLHGVRGYGASGKPAPFPVSRTPKA